MLDPRFETAATEEPNAIRCIHRSCDDLAADHDWHFHPQFELTWFLSSSGTRYVGDSVEAYWPGDLVLSGPNLPHCWRNGSGCPGGERPEWLSVQFAPSGWGEALMHLPESQLLRALLAEARAGLVFEPAAAERIGPELRVLCAEQGLPAILRLIGVLHELAGLPRRPLASGEYRIADAIDPQRTAQLDRIMDYIAQRFRGAISQAELAAELDLSAAAFSKFVRTATGTTFTGLVKRARINEACRLLAHSAERITDIALDCGYAHTSHFDHHFQELKGVTPSEYRRRMAGLAEARRKIGAIAGETGA